MSPLVYVLAYTIPALAAVALLRGGAWTLSVPLLVFGLIPLVELLWRGSTTNLDESGEAHARARRVYDWLVFGLVPVQVGLLALFCVQASRGAYSGAEWAGAIFTMGIMCGALGINVGHELGHRRGSFERRLAKVLLGTSLYVHFYIEHNRGHHARVATPEDPASARRGEKLYAFWWRSVTRSFRSAWALETRRLERRGLKRWSWHNEMLRDQTAQVVVLVAVAIALSPVPALAWVGAALVGALMLETVNYIEHYGLERERKESGAWARVQPHHSWNANQPLGRVLLFELTRHSDHHAHPTRPYQLLRHFDDAPQLPTGYPGMMLLAILPPLFFSVMHRRLAVTAAQAA